MVSGKGAERENTDFFKSILNFSCSFSTADLGRSGIMYAPVSLLCALQMVLLVPSKVLQIVSHCQELCPYPYEYSDVPG